MCITTYVLIMMFSSIEMMFFIMLQWLEIKHIKVKLEEISEMCEKIKIRVYDEKT